jgi:hypothetical protein
MVSQIKDESKQKARADTCSWRTNLLNPCLFEFNNVRMLQASDKGHLQFSFHLSIPKETIIFEPINPNDFSYASLTS